MRRVTYQDSAGRWWVSELPDHAPDSEAIRGVPVGPPSLEELELPLSIEVRLHNQLFERGILTERDARRRMPEIAAALSAALRVDVHAIANLYTG